jgi:phospholipid/cholesterol/gamma-HCH transport system substrate-binding protein
MKRLLATRGFMSILGVLAVIAAVAVAYVVVFEPGKKMIGYCAIMPDAIGLYTGNHVTIRGIPVGTVSSIEPQGTSMRVGFAVDATHPLRGAVSATTVSDTLVADRDLAILSGPSSDAEWNPQQCVTDTLTPKSMTETLRAIQKITGELGGSSDPTEQDRIRGGVAAIADATSGTGPRLNAMITKLGAAMKSPDAAVGHVGELISALSSLSASVSTNWADIKDFLPRLDELFTQVNTDVWLPVIDVVDSLRVILPWFNDITREFGGPILGGLDATVPFIRFVGANVGTLQEIINMIPPIVTAFSRSIDPTSGRPALSYAPPKVALTQQDAQQVCAAVNVLTPGRCATATNGMSDIDLVPLVLGLAGAR